MLRILPRAGLVLHTYLVKVKLLVADHPHHAVYLCFLFEFFVDLAETEVMLMVGVAIADYLGGAEGGWASGERVGNASRTGAAEDTSGGIIWLSDSWRWWRVCREGCG
jgi:hypothetical protein